MTDEEQKLSRSIRKYMSELGKKGGKTTVEKYGREHFVEMRKLSKGRTKVKPKSQ